MDTPRVYIIILNWNQWLDTIECLESLQRLSYDNYRIIVVDNGSINNSVDKILSWASGNLPVKSNFINSHSKSKPIHCIVYDRNTAEAGGTPEIENEINGITPDRLIILIRTGANLGFAGGNNVGIRYALKLDSDYIWLLNNDTVVDSEAIGTLITEAGADVSVGMVGSKILYYNQPETIWFAGGTISRLTGRTEHLGMNKKDSLSWSTSKDVDYATGCSLLVSKSLIKSIGLLDESYFLYYEETDWATRARKKGWRIRYQPNSKVYHKVSQCIGLDSPKMVYYISRSSIIYARKNLNTKLFLVLGSLIRFQVVPYLIRGKFRTAYEGIRGIITGIRDSNNN